MGTLYRVHTVRAIGILLVLSLLAVASDLAPTIAVFAQGSLAESNHPYANNYEYIWTVSEPGVSQMRLHFNKLELDHTYYEWSNYDDYIYILDKNNQQLATYSSSDNGQDIWTEWFTGDTLKIKLKTDGKFTAYGFVVDQKETRVSPAPSSSYLAESYHEYANNYEYIWTISEPGVSQMRLHFNKLELDHTYYEWSNYDDYIYILDKNNQQLATYSSSDNGQDIWTEWFTGDTLKIKLKTDGKFTAYGFVVDQKETRVSPAPSSSYLAESYHEYANNYEYIWTISEPGVSQMRIHFNKLELDHTYYGWSNYDDYIYILDKNNQQLATYSASDNGQDIWTEWFTGDTLKIKLKTDGKFTAYGFVVDQKETRGTGPTPTVTLTLYVHENSASGPVIAGARVIGQDGAGNSFDQTTNSNGYVTITGVPGTWSFTASKSGYDTNSWSQSITTTCEKHAYLIKQVTNVTLTLYVHEGSASGPIIVGAQITGQDGAGNSFSQTTNSNGYVTITGVPGTWSFTASKSGYDTNSWSQSIPTTCENHAYLIKYEGQIPEQAATCTLPPPTLISPAQATAEMALRPTFSWSSISGANRYWLVVAIDKNLLPTEPEDGFCEVYYVQTQDGGQWGTLFYPAYYQSTVVRLYYFDGKAVIPTESIVISYEEKVTSAGDKYKEITNGWTFPTYEAAQAYVASQTSGNYRIVGDSPFSSPVPLEELNSDVTSAPGVVISEIWLTSTSYTPLSNLDHSTTYWWQVQAFKWDGSKGVQLGQYSAQRSFTTEQKEVALTLYVHEGSTSGPIIVGAQVTGQDGGGISFDKTTSATGYVTITGVPGTWSFTASKTGYQTNSWSQSITTTCERHAYLIKQVTNVTLTLYVHENSASGPIIVGAQVTGQDGAGNSFSQTTNSNGYVAITGVPGTWSFTASKSGYDTNSWSQSITTTGEKHAYLVKDEQPNCVITLEQCQSGAYIDPHLPLCWEISGVGIGDSFTICVSNSTASNGIKEVRFSSDDTQNGVPTGQWTAWYDWDTSSGDWHAGSKCMTWSFATGGEKEIWVELKDSAGQTSQCFKEIEVVPLPEWFELPDTISLDEFAISSFAGSIVERIAQEGGEIDSFPIFLSGKLEFSDQPINIVLVCSPEPPTLYKLVRIKTNLVQDPRYIELVAIMESSSVAGCVWNTLVSQTILDWINHPGQMVLEKLAKAIADAIIKSAGLPALISTALITYGSILDCVENGYSDELEGFEDGKDYLVYLPIGYDFTIKAQRGFDPCQFQAGMTTVCNCPPPVQGMWNGTISETMNDINLEIREIPTWFCRIFSPGELRVYDSQGRITGLVDGQVRQEIPDSEYDETNKAVTVFSPDGPLVCKIVGTSDGTYDLLEGFFENGEMIRFAVLDIPMTNGATHQYSVNWDALSEGGEGVTVQVDSDGDGVFEETKTLQPPIASFDFSPSNISVNEEIDFDASQSSDADGEIVSYEWNFGDGNTSTGKLVTHAYSAPGEYTVFLVVVDNDGVVSTHSRAIQVGQRPGMPAWGWAIIAIGILVLAVIVLGRRRSVKA